MYATTAYLYQQIQEVLLIDISGVGDTFDRRWKPVYAKNLKLNRGVDNVILFQFQNQDQRPVNITGATFVFRMIDQEGENLLYAQQLVILNAATGRAKVTIPAADTFVFDPSPASWSLEITSGVLDQAVFTDDSAGARGVIDIVDSVFPAFVASSELTIPNQAPQGNVYYTSTLETNGAATTTFEIDVANITGNLSVQGSTDATAYTVEWYGVDFEYLNTQQTVANLEFGNTTQRLGINVEGYHPYLRLAFGIDSGNVDLIQYR